MLHTVTYQQPSEMRGASKQMLNIAALLQLCCSFVAALLQLYCSFIAASLQLRCSFVAALLQLCCSFVAALFQLYFTSILLQFCFIAVLPFYSTSTLPSYVVYLPHTSHTTEINKSIGVINNYLKSCCIELKNGHQKLTRLVVSYCLM